MSYKARDVAIYIIDKCYKDNKPVSNLLLQKLLYFIQHTSLKNSGRKFFEDDIEAYKFGPAVSSVYDRYCGYGSMPIYPFDKSEIKFIGKEKELIDGIIKEKLTIKPWELVHEINSPGKAWAITFNGGNGNKDVISIAAIKNNG